MKLIQFFNLNVTDEEIFISVKDLSESSSNSVMAYAAQSERAKNSRKITRRIVQKKLSAVEQCSLYFGLFIGVLAAPIGTNGLNSILNIYRSGWASMIGAALIALILTPLAYKKIRLDPKSPWIVRFGIFVQNGFFWQVLLHGIGKGI